MMLRILLVAVWATSFAAAQVRVTPDFNKVINEGDEAAFTYKCQNGDASSTVYPIWTNQQGAVIQTLDGGASERVYSSQSLEGPYRVTRLTFENVQMTENGNYTCAIGTNTVRKEVIVAIPITFPRQEMELSQRLLVGETSSITCTINSNPFPNIFWYFNTALIDPSDEHYDVSTQQVIEPDKPGFEHSEIATLEVNNVQTSDSGSYRCFASVDQTGDSLSLTMEVIVQVPPEWIVEPRAVSEVEGRDITIQCAASGTPDPTYTWLNEDGGVIVATEGKYELRDDGEFFTVLNLAASDDQVYTCVASNDAINSTRNTARTAPFRLEVLIPPALNAQNNETIAEGKDFSMDCFISRAEATGTLSWRRGGVTQDDIVNEGVWSLDSRVTVTSSDDGRRLTLALSPSHYDHSGGWTCYAESDAGPAQVTHYLSIESAPFVDRSETPTRVLTWPSNPVNMTCVFNGFPSPRIRWYVNNYVLNATENIQFLPDLPGGMSIVQMTPAESDFGPYVCRGSNSQGSNDVRIDLIEGTVPTEPQNVRLVDVGSSTMRVLYDEPEDDGGFDVLHYVIMFNSGLGTINTTREYDNITNVVIEGLSGNTRYYVWVAAVNDRGVGHFSTETSTTTLDNSTPDAPTITSPNDSEFGDKYELTWEHPVDNGGSAIINYHIFYSQVDGPDDNELTPRQISYSVLHTQRAFTLQSLNENKYYLVELSAENSVGVGKAAKKNFKTRGGFDYPTEAPKRPEQLIGDLGTTAIVAIVVACFIILLILIDVCCFCMNDCGVLMYFCVTCCGKTTPSSKDEIEMGDEEYGRTKTAPPTGDGPPTYQPIENGKPDEAVVDSSAQEEADPLMNKDGDIYADEDEYKAPYGYNITKSSATDC